MIDYSYILKNTKYEKSYQCNNIYDWNTFIFDNQEDKPNIENLIKKSNLIDCKDKAKQLIALSDWSVLPDVNISNKLEFESYRSQLRNLIINPVEDPIFPVEPNPIWSN